MICLKLIDKDGNTVTLARGEEKIDLAIYREYQPGDMLWLESSEEKGYLWLQVDDAIGKSLIYYTGIVKYFIPFAEKRNNISPKAGNRQLPTARTQGHVPGNSQDSNMYSGTLSHYVPGAPLLYRRPRHARTLQ